MFNTVKYVLGMNGVNGCVNDYYHCIISMS
jgi:hypothetical protein